MQRSQDAQKAMVSAVPYSKHNTARRKTKRKSPPEVPGVSEQLKPQDAIFQVRRKQSFLLTVLNAERLPRYLFGLMIGTQE